MVEYNDSINLYSRSMQYTPEVDPAKADSAQVSKPKVKIKPNSVFDASSTQSTPTTSTSQKPKPKTSAQKLAGVPKPASPKPPVAQEVTITSSNSTNDAGTTVGTFETNIPTFKDLNMKNQTATAVASGVGIYGGSEDDLVITENPEADPPTTTVSFKNKDIRITFNTPETPVEGSIIFDAEKGAYVLNNLDGIRLDAAHSGPNKQKLGGESFMINGGTVDFIDTCEREHEKEGHVGYDKLNSGVKTQNIVLKDVKVKDGAMTIGNDNVLAIGATKLDTSQIETLQQYTGDPNGKFTHSHIAYENHDNESSRLGLQTGFATRAAYTQWLGGDDKDMKAIKTNDEKGTVEVESDIFNSVNMKDVTVARTVGNLNIYTQNEDGSNISVIDNQDGTNTVRFKGRNLEFIIPADQKEDARIFVNEETGTLYFENLEGVRFNDEVTRGNGQYITQTNLFIKHCHFEYMNTIETTKKNGGKFETAENGDKTRSNIAIVDSEVDNLVASYDNIYIDENSNVKKYTGYRNNAPKDLEQNNPLKGMSARPWESSTDLRDSYTIAEKDIKDKT